MKTLRDLVQYDVRRKDTTPETPFLRFQEKPVNVFIWDEHNSGAALSDALELKGGLPIHARIRHRRAVTANSVLAYYNISTKADRQMYVFHDPSDSEYVNLPDYSVPDDPAPLEGSVWSLGLHALRMLDEYFDNNWEHYRVKVQIKPVGNPNHVEYAYVYVPHIEALGAWNSKTQLFDLDEDVDLVPLAVNSSGNFEHGESV